jgi:GNAT superfamily N-acetyltransferase
MGPIGFHDLDHEGMLVEGFEELNMSITFYNHPYYIKHMENLGLIKDIDWVEYQIKVPTEIDPRIERLSKRILERNDFKLVTYDDRNILYNDAFEAFKIIDVAFSNLYGTVPLTDSVIKKAVNDYIPLVNLNYICSIKNKENKIIGFAVMVPSIAKALKKSNGKMLPFGIFRLLKALKGKNDVLEMFFVAVDPEYQKLGIPGIILNKMIAICAKNKVKYCETGPELETNANVQGLWKSFETRQHKRRRCWYKEI